MEPLSSQEHSGCIELCVLLSLLPTLFQALLYFCKHVALGHAMHKVDRTHVFVDFWSENGKWLPHCSGPCSGTAAAREKLGPSQRCLGAFPDDMEAEWRLSVPHF